jgi:hypothetical protein
MATQSPYEYSPGVKQAVCMVQVQAKCVIEEALNLMAERAFIDHVSLDEIAAGVLDHSITFDD